jgi:hypothetical protein
MSVQSVLIMCGCLLGSILIDTLVYSWYSLPLTTISRALVFYGVIYSYPGVWFAALSSLLHALVVHQSIAEELLLLCCMVSLIRYARLRVVTTNFAYGVLFLGSYIGCELMFGIVLQVPYTYVLIRVGVLLCAYYGIFLVRTSGSDRVIGSLGNIMRKVWTPRR